MAHWSNEALGSCAFGAHETALPREDSWPSPVQPSNDADVFLPPPNPAHRLRYTLDPQDQRRLALHAALTAAGIPPMPEDRAAIDQISALPPAVNTVLQRWLHHVL
ncbi:hypothetical protein [Streptomyces sp. NPDC048643]|uniref:hypothetical protein n=1 Tax=Streptomyces sp. NPDC048643 TaxID=3155637 RepID=UPI003430FB53